MAKETIKPIVTPKTVSPTEKTQSTGKSKRAEEIHSIKKSKNMLTEGTTKQHASSISNMLRKRYLESKIGHVIVPDVSSVEGVVLEKVHKII